MSIFFDLISIICTAFLIVLLYITYDHQKPEPKKEKPEETPVAKEVSKSIPPEVPVAEDKVEPTAVERNINVLSSEPPAVEQANEPTSPSEPPAVEQANEPASPSETPAVEQANEPTSPSEPPAVEQTNEPASPSEPPAAEPENEPISPSEPPAAEPENELISPSELPVVERNCELTTPSEEQWSDTLDKVTTKATDISFGKLKVINREELDRLINVRGKKRPIAVFVSPKSSNLSVSGAFIYDTTKIPADNALYLFAGPECGTPLIELAEKLLAKMKDDCPTAQIVRVIRTLEGPEYQRMIHQIGGNTIMLQSAKNAGDELFFENQFFKTLLHIISFENGKMVQDQFINPKQPSLADLPHNGAAVIDTSDRALYLWISHSADSTPQEDADVEDALKWINQQPEYLTRDLVAFTQGYVPPNLAIILGTK